MGGVPPGERPIRISLGIGAPPQTAALLAQAGFDVVEDSAGEAEFTVSFAPAAADERGNRTAVQCLGPEGRARGASLLARGGIEAASCVASQVSEVGAPMLTADARTYSAIAQAIHAARQRLSLLVEGETGTGKKLLVGLYHAMSGRGLLLLINGSVASVSRVANAPTGVRGPGTLFLDNVDELSKAEQAAVLGVIRAAGESRSLATGADDSTIRYAAATRRPLEQMVRRGRFDRELYRELAATAVYLPPLRERRADLAMLANYFLSLSGPHLGFTPDALEVLSHYPFPGNVRELENLVRRLSIVPLAALAGSIDGADVRNQIMVAARQKAEGMASWRSCLDAAEREIALRTVAAYAGDYRAAARRLGMTLSMLRERVGASGHARGGEPPRS